MTFSLFCCSSLECWVCAWSPVNQAARGLATNKSMPELWSARQYKRMLQRNYSRLLKLPATTLFCSVVSCFLLLRLPYSLIGHNLWPITKKSRPLFLFFVQSCFDLKLYYEPFFFWTNLYFESMLIHHNYNLYAISWEVVCGLTALLLRHLDPVSGLTMTFDTILFLVWHIIWGQIKFVPRESSHFHRRHAQVPISSRTGKLQYIVQL